MTRIRRLITNLQVQRLIANLQDPDPQRVVARRGAAIDLGELGDPRAVEPLVVALRDDNDYGVRGYAAEALGIIGDPRAVEPLIAALHDADDFVRSHAARALGKIGDPQAIQPLILALASTSTFDRDIPEVIATFGPTVLEPLVEALGRENPAIRSGAVSALSSLGSTATEKLIAALGSSAAAKRAAAAQALGRISDPDAVEPLISALQDDQTAVVVAAAEALGMLKASNAAESLVTLTQHNEAQVRAAAAKALGEVGDTTAIQPLITLLRDKDGDVQREAKWSLGKLGEPAIEHLIAQLTDENEDMRRNTAQALALIGDYATEPLLEQLYAPQWQVRQAAAESLGSINYTTHARVAVEGLLAALQDPSINVRQTAAASLGGIGSDTAIEGLFSLVERRREPARQAAANALVQLHGDQVFGVITKGLNHPDPRVQLAIIRALDNYIDHITKDSFFPKWFYVFKDFYHISVSESAKTIVDTLVELAHSSNKLIREAALVALETIREKIEQKRLEGALDAHYSWGGPLPKDQLHDVSLEEQAATAAITEAMLATPTPRYADFTFYHDSSQQGDRPVDAQPLRSGQWYQLEVAIRERPVGLPPEEDKRRPIREPKQQKDVTIVVTAEGDGFEIEEPVQPLILPPLGDSRENAWFRVRPLRKSANSQDLVEMRVRLYYEFNLIEVVVIRAEVIGAFDDAVDSQPDTKQWVWFRQERIEREYMDFDNIQPRAMHIDIRRQEDLFRFTFLFKNATNQEVEFNALASLSTTDLEDDLITIRNLWYDIAMSKTFTERLEGDKDEFLLHMRNLAKVGRRLWVKLFKRERKSALTTIGKWLESHPLEQGGIIQISLEKNATDFVFPWTLLYDRPVPRPEYELPDMQGFWGVRYCIEQRLPSQDRGTDSPVEVKDTLELGFMLWEQFRNAKEQKELMESLKTRSAGKLSISTPPITDAEDCYALLSEVGSHIIYFYTHGYTRHRLADIGVGPNLELFIRHYERLDEKDPVRAMYRLLYESIKQDRFEPDRSWIELTYGKLYLDELYDILELPSKPLVILNMCESAQITPSLSDSFIDFFLDRGARGVIGTECPMTVEFAHPLAAKLLEDLLHGIRAGDALLNARRYFLEHQNPLGLAYSLYGNATTQFMPPRF